MRRAGRPSYAGGRMSENWTPLSLLESGGTGALVVFRSLEGERRRTWDEIAFRAVRSAAGLARLGVKKRDPVACVFSNSPEALAAALGAWLLGCVIVSLPIPARNSAPEEYGAKLRELCARAEADLLLVDERARQGVDALLPGGPRVVSFDSLEGGSLVTPDPPAGHGPAFIQFTSGTTGPPKGCLLTMDAIGAQLRMLTEHIELDGRRDRWVGWLPLSHDFGFFGTLACWSLGIPSLIGAPERFLVSPETWMQDCADFGATLTGGPSSALAMAARHARIAPPASSFPMRACIVGGERVRWEALAAAVDVLGPYGLGWRSLAPAYGMAEATLAIWMVRPGELPDSVVLDRHVLADGEIVEISPGRPEAIRLTGAGTPLPGVLLESSAGGGPGPIKVRSASLARGYLAGATKSRKLVVDGKLRPDDLGFVRDGRLYPVGRTADVVVADGRRVIATEVEDRLQEVAGVRPGSAVLLDVPWHDGAVVVAEPSRSVTHHHELAARLAQQCYVTTGIMPRESVVAERDALPKTPSGKVQRFRVRELLGTYDSGMLARIECDERLPATGLRPA